MATFKPSYRCTRHGVGVGYLIPFVSAAATLLSYTIVDAVQTHHINLKVVCISSGLQQNRVCEKLYPTRDVAGFLPRSEL